MKYSLLILAVVCMAYIVRIPLLDGSFWLDEAAQALESTRPFSQQLDIKEDFQPPLIHYLVHFASYISTQEWWLRTWAALLPGIASIFISIKIAEHLFKSKAISTITGVLISLSSFHVFYSQELRPYALPLMFAVLSFYLQLKLLDKKKITLFRDPLHLALLISTAAGLYSSYLYPFFIVFQILFLVFCGRKRFHQVLSAIVAGGLLLLPWLPKFFEQLAVGTQLQSQLPGWSQVVSIPQLKVLPLVYGKFLFGVLNIEPTSVWFLLPVVCLGLCGGILLLNKLSASQKRAVLTTLLWLVVPVVTAWLVSFVVPVLRPKRVLFTLPAFYMLIAALSVWGIESKQKLSYFAGWGMLGITLIIQIVSLAGYWANPQFQRENWKDAITTLESIYPEGDTLVISAFPDSFAPWRWYSSGTFDTLPTGTYVTQSDFDYVSFLKPVTEYQYVIVFDYLRDLTDPENKLPQEIQSYGLKEAELYDYSNIGFIRVYAQPQALLTTILQSNQDHVTIEPSW